MIIQVYNTSTQEIGIKLNIITTGIIYLEFRMMNGIVESETHLKRKIIEQFKEKNFNFFVKDEKEIEMLKPTPKNEDSNKNLK